MKGKLAFLLVPLLVALLFAAQFRDSALSSVSVKTLAAALMDPIALLAQRSPGGRSGPLVTIKGKKVGPHERVLSTVRDRPAPDSANTPDTETLPAPVRLDIPPGAIAPPISTGAPLAARPTPIRGSIIPTAFAGAPSLTPPIRPSVPPDTGTGTGTGNGTDTGNGTGPTDTNTPSPASPGDAIPPNTAPPETIPPGQPNTPPLSPPSPETPPGGSGTPGDGTPGGGTPGGGTPGGGTPGGGGAIPVPEPSAWSMMIVGLFFLGFAARGRKAKSRRD